MKNKLDCENCTRIPTDELIIPDELFAAAGIPKNADLDVICGDGEIIITQSFEEENDDVLAKIPPALMNKFIEHGISEETIRSVLKGCDFYE